MAIFDNAHWTNFIGQYGRLVAFLLTYNLSCASKCCDGARWSLGFLGMAGLFSGVKVRVYLELHEAARRGLHSAPHLGGGETYVVFVISLLFTPTITTRGDLFCQALR